MASAFDVVRTALEAPAGPDLVAAVESLTVGQVDELAERILDTPRSAALPARPVTEIWPLIPLRASLFFDHLNNESPATDYSPSGIRLSAATDPRVSGTGEFSSGIIRALLYSHGLVIEDPLSHAAEMHLSQHREFREVSRLGISSAVASLSEIAALLDNDIVATFYTGGAELNAAGELGNDILTALDAESASYTVQDAWDEFEVEFVSGLSPALQGLWREIRAGNRSPDVAPLRHAVEEGDSVLAETFIDVLRILNPRSIVENAITGTASTIALIQLLGGSSDVLCASPLMGRLLFVGTPDPVQQLRVHEVARTSVPNIDALSPTDLVSIRQSSDALATWRHDLAEALDYAERMRQIGNSPATVQQGVSEMLAEARQQLHKEAERSRVWRRENLVNFIAGGLGGAGGAVVGGTTAAIAGGAVSGVVAAFIQAAGQQQHVPGFLDRHYVAFAKPTAD
ncbi:MAG: hypothetical protein QM619_06645 [Micropruina sp.]|uniref:hypothetical protein n=1 Tax=Micropruina sp. TaxID=2737536 RepID=UPI0039E33656